ncbi:two-component system sensor histidine kinase KdpD [Frigoribacterium sp. PvP054]|uniref:ATP-binding protein n=1 Tax=Frigoribacterium sp. PvP054 TaxID=3156438 RepID=UPI0033948AA1
MRRGRLRVLLGAAPGVGKTYTMLEEGARLAREGKDVVVAVVETHGRVATASLLGDLEIVPRTTTLHRGVELTEMDVDAVLARRPDLALVDELAHTNAPGSVRQKRWQDVQVLLDAGIDVVSTVNVQHIESLNDVVEKITGAAQRETVPDSMLRSADQIEVVDLAPQALRDRLAEGNVYPAARIDAALSNYFRLGNLTALRELALLWLADEVDSALKAYRVEHGIDSKWEARERVVVALTGGPEGETLIRRGARIAARSSGGELVTVHVIAQDGLRDAHPGALSAQRALTEKLGGTHHEVVGGDVPVALVQFAKAMNASQLVIGVSRRSRVAAALTGPGIGATVVRESGDIDVHIVTHSAAGGRFTLPRAGGALTLRRRLLGAALAVVLGPLVTWLLVMSRSDESLTSDVLVYQLLVVVVALVGGIWPALFAAVLSGVTLDYFFVEPYDSITVGRPLHLLTLVLYVVIALLVSYVVDQAARRSRSAARALAESELLATVAGGVIRGQDALHALLSRTREAFRLRSVSVVGRDGDVVDTVGPSDGSSAGDGETTVVPAGDGARLEMVGPPVAASERRLLTVIAAQVETALEHRALTATADSARPMAQVDQVRTALLAAVGHDLRRPLASATAAVTGLQQTEVVWGERDRDELLTTARESLDALSSLVTNLLDVSRVQAGALAVSCQALDVGDVLFAAVDELQPGPGRLDVEIAGEVPPVAADPVLLQRVLVNLLDNAVEYAPADVPVRLTASTFGPVVEIRVADRGPGISPDRLDLVFVPFQRLGDTDNTAGLGLGLAIAKGFTEGMGGHLTAEETPGGGLTVVVALPVVGVRTGGASA